MKFSLCKLNINIKIKLILKISYFGLSFLIFQLNKNYIFFLFPQTILIVFMEKYTGITSKKYIFKALHMRKT